VSQQQQPAAASGKPGATIVQKAPVAPAKASKEKEAPRINNLGALFIGKEVHIYSPKANLIGVVYNDFSEKEPFCHFGPVKLLDASFGENGEPQWALVEYRERNARKFFNTDLIPLQGCSVSLTEIDPDYVAPTSKEDKEGTETKN